MEFSGQERIAAGRDVVWAALNDPQVLMPCIPGCRSLEMVSPGEFTAVIKIKIGPLPASFSGTISLSNVRAPESYTISVQGKGGIAGFAKGSADVVLIEEVGETLLVYDARAELGGKLAQLGSRLIASTSSKLARRFFADLNAAVSARAAADS